MCTGEIFMLNVYALMPLLLKIESLLSVFRKYRFLMLRREEFQLLVLNNKLSYCFLWFAVIQQFVLSEYSNNK